MKKRIFFIIISLLLLSGCSINYNLKVDKDFKINEKLEMSVEKNKFEIGYDKPEDGVKDIFNNINTTLTYKLYDYKTNKKSGKINTIFNKKYLSVEDYSNSVFLKNANGKAEKYDYEKNGKTNKVFQVTINYDFFDFINTRKYSSIAMDDFKLNITFPYKVIESNADSVNGNVLTWNLKDLRKARSFYIEYDENIEVKEKNNKVLIIIACAALIVSVFLIIIIFRKRTKNNSDI